MESEQAMRLRYGGAASTQVDHSDVRLTRFSSLDNVDTQPSAMITTRRTEQVVDMQEACAGKSNGLSQFVSQDENGKWPWSRGSRQDMSLKQQEVVLDPTLLQEAEATRGKEDFRVIWRQLAFEVQTWTYDQVIGRSLHQVRSLFSTGRSNKKQVMRSDSKSSSYKRVIFENLNGHISSGEISAILGPSGAGKTSLINAICSKANQNYRGQVRLIGGGSSRRMRVSVIPQKDYLVDRLTVRENLLFGSRVLNTDRGFDHEANILHLAKMLNLTNCLGSSTGSISGGEYKRVSIAQELLKRPDILILDEPTSGLDSVNCKNLIRSLRSLIEASRCGAINPMAIVLTIHQPDVEIFHMFDHIYCMARAGRTVYEGHPSRALEVIRSHAGISDGAHQRQFDNVNPANLLIELASEFVYGPTPIERLNKFQLKQFEHQHQQLLSSSASALHDSPSGQPTEQQQPKLSNSWPSMMNHLVAGSAAAAADKSSSTSTTNDLPAATEAAAAVQATSPSPSSFSVCSLAASAGSTETSGAAAAVKRCFNRDKRLNSKVDHSGKFWHQMCLLTRRNFISDMRDPLMAGTAVMFHLMIPLVMWVAYSRKIGSVKACPVIHREMELLALASDETAAKLAELQEEFTVALECSTMFFLVSYCFSLRSLSMAALSFPLSMHVLVKESRNGWYNVTAYVLAKTVSSLLTEVLLPVMSVVLIYLVMDMPQSPYQWRLWAVALVMALVSLISTVQGLIWGALSMDSVQMAIYMGSASSLPLVLLSGFTARIKQMPVFMQNLSWISLYRYSSDAINIIRFGFGLCPCDAATDNYLKQRAASFTDLPDRMKPLFTFYLANQAEDSGDAESGTVATQLVNGTLETLLSGANATSSVQQEQRIAGISYDLLLNSRVRNDMLKRMESNEMDLFGKMAQLLAKSFSYGREITGCDSVRSQLLEIGGFPKDDYLPAYYVGLAIMFLLLNILLLLVVKLKVSRRV